MAAAQSEQAASIGLAQLSLGRSAQQVLELVSQCKESVQQLRSSIKEAKSHRGKCCEVLGAALTAILALDQAVHSSSQHAPPSQGLQKLCGEIIAAIDLAQRRVQIFSSQPRLVKYAYLPNKRVVEGKLNHVIAQLESLTQQVWDMQNRADTAEAEASSGMPGSSKNIALELERVYTPRSVAAIQAALSTLDDKLASGHTQHNLPACEPLIALQRRGAFQQVSQSQATAHTSTQTSPKQQLVQTASFDSAQSHNNRQLGEDDFPSRQSGSARSSLEMPLPSDQPSTSQMSPVVKRAPPPPSSNQDGGLFARATPLDPHQEGPHARPPDRSTSQYSTEDDVVNSSVGQSRTMSSRSTYSPFEATTQSPAAQRAAQQLQSASGTAQPLSPCRSRPPSAETLNNTQHVSDWAMQARMQSDFDTLDNSSAIQPHRSGQIHARSETGTPHISASLPTRGMLRAQSHTPRTRVADQLHPAPVQTPARGHRATLEACPSMASSQGEGRRTSHELYRDVYAPSVRSSSYDVFESLGCSVIPYDELDIKRKIGDGSIGQVYLGRWQQTDVAVKVLTEMQNLASKDSVTPQDPATLQPWETEDSDDKCPQQGGEKRTHAKGLIGVTSSNSGDGSPAPQSNATITTLEREVSIMASLRHPNVVMFMGLCLEPPCIVTEFCARGSLFDVLRKARSSPPFAQQLDWPKRLGMALDASKGMLQLHSHKPPILHRDLKSPNMLVERHWRVKVTDFNLSRMVHTGEQNASVTSLLANNPRWLAPEVVRDHDYSKAADVYSFGIIMWEMMTWRLPWEELNPFQIMLRLNQQDRPEVPPLDTLPGQPLPGVAGYIQLMKECWDEDPKKRPGFEHIIISVRGLLEGATNQHKLQKTLTEVPRLGNTTSAVPPNMNKLPVVGQTPFDAKGSAPQDTPTPLVPLDDQKPPIPLQVYQSDRAFFGSAPVGGLEILTSSVEANEADSAKEEKQKTSLSGGPSQQAVGKIQSKRRTLKRRHTWNGTSAHFADVLSTKPDSSNHNMKHVGSRGFRPKPVKAAPV